MEYRTYCKNQREVATVFNKIVDEYWAGILTENEMKENILCICEHNEEKIYKDGKYTKILQQQCGKKRMNLISKVLKNGMEIVE